MCIIYIYSFNKKPGRKKNIIRIEFTEFLYKLSYNTF